MAFELRRDPVRGDIGRVRDVVAPTLEKPDGGNLSLMKMAPWLTKTPSSISTPVQMKAWLWILQFAPMRAYAGSRRTAQSATWQP